MSPEMRRLIDVMIADTGKALAEGAPLHKTLTDAVYTLLRKLQPYYLEQYAGKR